MPTVLHTVPARAVSPRVPDRRLDDIAWGLFLLLTGGLWLIPEGRVPAGAWLVGAGLILMGLNAVRYLTHRAVSTFTVLVGVLAFAGGLAESTGTSFPFFGLLVVLVGASIILRAVFPSRS